MELSNENIIHVKNGNIEYIQFKKLLQYNNVITHAFSIGKDVNFRSVKTNKKRSKRNM